MAENAAGGAVAGRGSTNHDEGTRGRPYYEKLRSDLRACIDKKLKNDRQLVRCRAFAIYASTVLVDQLAHNGMEPSRD